MLPVTRPDGTIGTIPIRKGSSVPIVVSALHKNRNHFNTFFTSCFYWYYIAHHWTDPETFNPSRFLGNYPKDAFLPFSGGISFFRKKSIYVSYISPFSRTKGMSGSQVWLYISFPWISLSMTLA